MPRGRNTGVQRTSLPSFRLRSSSYHGQVAKASAGRRASASRAIPLAKAADAESFSPRTPIIVVLVLAAFWGVQSVSACDCFEPTFETAVKQADAIFVGEVVSIESRKTADLPWLKAIHFRATEQWKGVAKADVTVLAGGVSDCDDYVFEQGKRYLVFAHHAGLSGELSTGQCCNNRLIWRDYELRDIRSWRKGKFVAR